MTLRTIDRTASTKDDRDPADLTCFDPTPPLRASVESLRNWYAMQPEATRGRVGFLPHPVILTSADGSEIVFESAVEASEFLRCSSGVLRNVIDRINGHESGAIRGYRARFGKRPKRKAVAG